MPKKRPSTPSTLPTDVIPDEQWRRLFDLANEVRKAEPWLSMPEHKHFGLQMPGTGETVFVSVMGVNGEHLAMALYPDARALHGFLNIAYTDRDEDILDTMCDNRQTQVAFGNKGDLQWYEKALLERLSLKFTGRMAWPLFRRVTPGWMPWAITPEDARWLETAMEQLLELEARLFSEPDLLDPAGDDSVLVRVPVAGPEGARWTDTVRKIEAPHVHFKFDVPPDTLRKVRDLPRRQAKLEFDVFATAIQIAETRWEHPRLPYMMLAVDRATEFVLATQLLEVATTLDDMRTKVPAELVAALLKTGLRPRQLVVSKDWLHAMLGGVCRDLDIELVQASKLPTLRAVRRDLESQFR
jgi:hypothetical protein